jgi:hypothetical protein
MSEHIELLDERKVITSFAGNGKYFLAVHNKKDAPYHFLAMLDSDKEYSDEEYCNVLKDLWDKYIHNDEKPKLLEQTLSNEGFIVETLHCIAPGAEGRQSPLLPFRKSFAYWLELNLPKMVGKIDNKELDSLRKELNLILRYPLEQIA